jgi:hypothetical protein
MDLRKRERVIGVENWFVARRWREGKNIGTIEPADQGTISPHSHIIGRSVGLALAWWQDFQLVWPVGTRM